MKKAILILIMAVCALPAVAQDIRLNIQTSTAVITKNRSWDNMNQVWIFRPSQPQISLYIFIKNRNPTNLHTLTLRVYQTPDPTTADWTNNQGDWVQDNLNGTGCSGVLSIALDSTTACYVVTMFASQVAIRVTGAASAAGSPDSANIFIIQAVGEPRGQTVGSGGVQGVIGESTSVTGVAPILIGGRDQTGVLQAFGVSNSRTFPVVDAFTPADNTSNAGMRGFSAGSNSTIFPALTGSYSYNGTGWDRTRGNVAAGQLASEAIVYNVTRGSLVAGAVKNTLTNPTAGTDILNLQGSAAPTTVAYLIFSSTVATSFEVHLTSAAGATCTALTVRSLQSNQSAPTAWTANHTCTTDPTSVAEVVRVVTNGNTVQLVLPATMIATGTGVMVKINANITGDATVSALVFNN